MSYDYYFKYIEKISEKTWREKEIELYNIRLNKIRKELRSLFKDSTNMIEYYIVGDILREEQKTLQKKLEDSQEYIDKIKANKILYYM